MTQRTRGFPEDRVIVTMTILPAAWASALVNRDFSGLTRLEAERCNKRIGTLRADGWEVVSIADNAEPWFTACYDRYDPESGFTGGEVLEYTIARTREWHNPETPSVPYSEEAEFEICVSQGEDAFDNGLSSLDNPYPEGTPQAAKWLTGYRRARRGRTHPKRERTIV